MLSSMAFGYFVGFAVFTAALLLAHWRRSANEPRKTRAAGEEKRPSSEQAAAGGGGFLRANRDIAAFAAAGTLALSLIAGVYDAPWRVDAATRASSADDIADLRAYARTMPQSFRPDASNSQANLPDVATMIERLEARLEKDPENRDGWRMLGWSYFNTGRYEAAAEAYARAIEIDPDSAELKLAFEEAKKKIEPKNVDGAASATATTGADGAPDKVEALNMLVEPGKQQKVAALPEDQQALIHSMVDGLAARLDASPRDAEGWIKLLRSRMVLGERELAVKALRRALDEFGSEPEPRASIAKVADELGLGHD